MESTALEEKINKIRLRNEEIKRRHEEVEADKKNAAKLDALVEPLPADDWPERKEPPEFSAPISKHNNKSKNPMRKQNDQGNQYYNSGDGKKNHNFSDGQGPPPDPKYNFLADSEREEYGEQISKDTDKNRGKNKSFRGAFKRRGSGREWHTKEQWGQNANPSDMTASEYEAWRAERNRIDEARISRQRTAEGNWRREWDNDKVHLTDDITKRENRVTLGDIATRHEHCDNDKHYRSPRTNTRNTYHNPRESHHVSAVSETNKNHGMLNDPEKRVVIATDKSIKVMVNHGNTSPKSSVMSVKVSSPNIVGSGRVGPRQRPRVMYSSQQSEVEVSHHDGTNIARQKSLEEKTKSRQFDQSHKIVPKSPHAQRRRDGDTKSGYQPRRDNDKVEGAGKSIRKDSQKSPYPQRRGNGSNNYPPKSPRNNRKSTDSVKQKSNNENRNATCSRDTIKSDIVGNSENSKKNSEKKIDNLTKETFEETKNTSESKKIEESSIEESTASSAIDNIDKTEEYSEKMENKSSDESMGEASCSRESNENSKKNIDHESADSQEINCSANSGITSNDSGYIELSSENSIHDLSENDNVETSGIADSSSESLNFNCQIVEENQPVENLEVEQKLFNEQDASISLSNNSENTLETIDDNSKVEEKSNDVEKESKPVNDNSEIILKVNEEKIIDSSAENKSDEVTKNSEMETKSDNSVTSVNVAEKIDNNLENSITENTNVEETKLKSVNEESNKISDLKKKAENSGEISLDNEIIKTENSASIPDEIETVSSQLEKQNEDLKAEVSVEKNETKNSNDMPLVSETESSTAVEKN